MWQLMNRCWVFRAAIRPKINEILQELGVTILRDELENVIPEGYGIPNTFWDPQSVSIDLVKVEQILSEVRGFTSHNLPRF